MLEDKEITVYPTYGYRTGNTWTIPLRIWVHKPRRIDAVPADLIRVLLDEERGGNLPSAQEVIRCRECIADFLADDDSGESVSFQFDTGDTVYRFESKTDHNGLVEETFEAPGGDAGWLTVTAEVQGGFGKVFRGTGRVRLLEPQGKSVVSDIDDTIKVSEIPAGGRIVLRNTFLRDYVVAEGMRDRYVGFGDVSFHYVSGSPWQMYRVLDTFLIKQSGFPEGTFHMKSLRKNLLDLRGFVRDLRNFVAGKAYTKEQKLEQISGLLQHLPQRQFTLIGDSGELDPEVFTELRAQYPAQVEKIIIRDVVAHARTRPTGSHTWTRCSTRPSSSTARRSSHKKCRAGRGRMGFAVVIGGWWCSKSGDSDFYSFYRTGFEF
jgi:phosphatidate phosphatase APP1